MRSKNRRAMISLCNAHFQFYCVSNAKVYSLLIEGGGEGRVLLKGERYFHRHEAFLDDVDAAVFTHEDFECRLLADVGVAAGQRAAQMVLDTRTQHGGMSYSRRVDSLPDLALYVVTSHLQDKREKQPIIGITRQQNQYNIYKSNSLTDEYRD